MCGGGRKVVGGRGRRGGHERQHRGVRVLDGNVAGEVGADIGAVGAVRAREGLLPRVDDHVAAEAELVLVALEGLATHGANGARLRRALAQHAAHGRGEDRGCAAARLQRHTRSVSRRPHGTTLNTKLKCNIINGLLLGARTPARECPGGGGRSSPQLKLKIN